MKSIRLTTAVAVIVLMSLFHIGPIFAQVAVVNIEPDDAPTPFKLSAGYGHLFKTDVDGGGNFSRDGFRFLFNGKINFSSDFKLVNIIIL